MSTAPPLARESRRRESEGLSGGSSHPFVRVTSDDDDDKKVVHFENEDKDMERDDKKESSKKPEKARVAPSVPKVAGIIKGAEEVEASFHGDGADERRGLVSNNDLEMLREELREEILDELRAENEAFFKKKFTDLSRSINEQLLHAATEMEPTQATEDDTELQSTRLCDGRYEEVLRLPDDTYGFIICSAVGSYAWSVGLFVILLQFLLFSLFLLNITNFESDNPFNVPADVDTAVRVTQIFAILISVFVQDDLRTAVEMGVQSTYPGFRVEIHHSADLISYRGPGQDEEMNEEDGDDDAQEQMKNDSMCRKIHNAKWGHSVFLRGAQGLLSLLTAFVLIIQSDNVFDLLLNFTAIMFISELDEICFKLAKNGYVGGPAKDETQVVLRSRYFFCTASKVADRRYHSLLFLFVTLVMYSGYAVIATRQDSSLAYFHCGKGGIRVEFGDVVVPGLGIYTGVYGFTDEKIGSRVVYEHAEVPSAKLAFCEGQTFWTFFNNDAVDPCTDYQARSSTTESFDVMKIASQPWFSINEIPLEHIELSCDSTFVESCAGIALGERTTELRQEFCPALTVPGSIPNGFAVDVTRHFEILSGVQVYKHPVYWGTFTLDVLGLDLERISLILFTGRRWVLTDTSFFEELKTATTALELEVAMADINLHGTQFPNEAISFVSDAVDTSTDSCSPLGLAWHHATYPDEEDGNLDGQSFAFPMTDLTRPVSTFLACSTCNNQTNPCQFGGTCHGNGTCACRNGATGTLCEVPPLHNGRCNGFFNKGVYDYDGGDCCGATCDFPICGLLALGEAFGSNLTFASAGFPDCRDPAMIPITITVESDGGNSPDATWNAEVELECDSTIYVSLPFGNRLNFGTSETVRVKDGAECSFTMNPQSAAGDLRVRLTQDSKSLLAPEIILRGGVEETVDFPVISSCLRNDLLGVSPLPDTESPQYESLRWLNSAPTLDGFGCGEPLLEERFALGILNFATGDVLRARNGSEWLSVGLHCSRWEGVFCSADARVSRFNLEQIGLVGTIPSEIGLFSDLDHFLAPNNLLSGSIPTEIGVATDLVQLNLRNNQLTGLIPSELGLLGNLEHLILGINLLNGNLPSEIGKMTSLETLDVFQTELSGPVPTELGLLTALESLELTIKQSGPMPSILGLLTDLSRLYFTDSELSGSIPSEIWQLTKLGDLRFDQNALTGTISSEIQSLKQLRCVDFNSNDLVGPIPSEIGLVAGLKELKLYANGLSGTIPTRLGRLSELEVLRLDANGLSGPIPSEIGQLKLDLLSLSSNQLNGTIPTQIEMLTDLTTLSLRSNELVGAIPSEIGLLTNLSDLRFDQNALTGTISSEIQSLKQLSLLFLASNQLNGTIPTQIGMLTDLTTLSLRSNELVGAIPSEIGMLTNLKDLFLFSNGLSGTIPTRLGRLSELEMLRLDANGLSGPIPSEIGQLKLGLLSLFSNQLNGTIPTQIGMLTDLTTLSLRSNELVGAIPSEIGLLTNLRILSLRSNNLSGPLPSELGLLTGLRDLAVYSNVLSGPLPTELGLLTELSNLALHDNDLSGPLPSELGLLAKLTNLSLQLNPRLDLTVIPDSIIALCTTEGVTCTA